MTYDRWKTRSQDDDIGDAPEIMVACEACGGEGHTLDSRYGGNDPDVWAARCSNCSGVGFFICEAEGAHQS